MGSKPQSPCCGKHGTGRPGGQRKPQPDPGPWGCPACGGNRVLVPSVSHIWAALATQPGSALHVWSPSWPVSARGSIPSVGSQRLFAEDTSGQEGAVGLGPGLGTHGPPVTVAGGAGRPVGGLWKHPHQRRQVKWKRNRRGRFCHRFRWATSSNSGLRAAVCTMRRISSTEVAVKIYNSRKVHNERPTSKIGQQS